ncbi:MAG: radical SAM protein [Candidatus Omnitrophota bacterium]|nr:MAG: radical SAM protein [Candidatus Omnitrophota bacterium]
MSKYKYIYGPVASWRLGSSLGIDLLSQEGKICNFDCVYCQLGPAKEHSAERKTYVPTQKVLAEIKTLPLDTPIDFITFSGRGEPTLAANLGEAIKEVKALGKAPIAVLTNSALIKEDQVRQELSLADFVVAKLDACSLELLEKINRPLREIDFTDIVDGIKKFKKGYQGRLALQIMFIPYSQPGSNFLNSNKGEVNKFIYLANYIKPDEIQVNTPLRPCSITALPKEEIFKIKDLFSTSCKNIKIVSVYGQGRLKEVVSLSDADTLSRRGKTKH